MKLLPGAVITVLGILRIDLAIVSWRTKNPNSNGQNTLKWSLPYEMIIVLKEGTELEGPPAFSYRYILSDECECEYTASLRAGRDESWPA